jgi:exosome complex component RRP41
VDIPIAVTTRSGKISLLQMDGMIKAEDIKKGVALGKKACQKIFEIQKKALKEKYNTQ